MASFHGRHVAVERVLGRVSNDAESVVVFRWAVRALVSIVWISAAIFGLYIVAGEWRQVVNCITPDKCAGKPQGAYARKGSVEGEGAAIIPCSDLA